MKLIEKRHNNIKEKSKRVITNRLSAEREKYEISLEKYLLNKKQQQELQTQKVFKKFEGYVSTICILNIIYIFVVFFNEREKIKTK